MAHACNRNTQEAGARRPHIQGQPGVCSKRQIILPMGRIKENHRIDTVHRPCCVWSAGACSLPYPCPLRAALGNVVCFVQLKLILTSSAAVVCQIEECMARSWIFPSKLFFKIHSIVSRATDMALELGFSSVGHRWCCCVRDVCEEHTRHTIWVEIGGQLWGLCFILPLPRVRTQTSLFAEPQFLTAYGSV